jgi:hypothetical protein
VPSAPEGFLTRHPYQGAVKEPEVRIRELVDSMKPTDQSVVQRPESSSRSVTWCSWVVKGAIGDFS